MRIMVCINTAEAEDGYEEENVPTFADHKYEIEELLRQGHYNVEYVDESRDGE